LAIAEFRLPSSACAGFTERQQRCQLPYAAQARTYERVDKPRDEVIKPHWIGSDGCVTSSTRTTLEWKSEARIHNNAWALTHTSVLAGNRVRENAAGVPS